jgi:imidazolonepropionase-like amidohydrolase
MRYISLGAVLCFAIAPFAYAQDLAIVDATVYVSPQAAPQTRATILVRHGKIAAVGEHVAVPPGTRTLQCEHCVVLAGFWNVHVHFTGPEWVDVEHLPAAQLTTQLQAMLTHSGFATVVDLASDPANTTALRRRIESGEVRGPHIYTAGFGLFPPNAIPFYLKDLPAPLLARLPQPATPAAAVGAVQSNLAFGTDVVKLFTGSYVADSRVVPMPVEIARAAASEGHRHSQLVFAHPSNVEGIRVAIDSGVDVLAHAPDTVTGVDDALIHEIVAHHMAMTPTLKLFSQTHNIIRIRQIVAQFHAFGGVLIFGTDTGYLTDYDVSEEYRQLALAGLSFRDVLAMLTTAPATKFNVSPHAGTIRINNDGDLTVLASDPSTGSLTSFADVLYTIRNGQVIYERAHD